MSDVWKTFDIVPVIKQIRPWFSVATSFVGVWKADKNAETRYVFLDEPLTNLDINYQQEFLKVFGVHTRFIVNPVNGLPVMVYE